MHRLSEVMDPVSTRHCRFTCSRVIRRGVLVPCQIDGVWHSWLGGDAIVYPEEPGERRRVLRGPGPAAAKVLPLRFVAFEIKEALGDAVVSGCCLPARIVGGVPLQCIAGEKLCPDDELIARCRFVQSAATGVNVAIFTSSGATPPAERRVVESKNQHPFVKLRGFWRDPGQIRPQVAAVDGKAPGAGI